jgi:glycerophosphoryl diester phosphodiesterase
VVDRRLVGAAHARGLQVHVWTINDPTQMRELLDLGVDGIVTDRIDLMLELLNSE